MRAISESSPGSYIGTSPRSQAVDLGLVDVYAVDVTAEVSEAGGRHETDVSGADHPDRLSACTHEGRRLSKRSAQPVGVAPVAPLAPVGALEPLVPELPVAPPGGPPWAPGPV